jgi:phosphoribosyl-AMP cyclohydrolase
MTTVPSHKRAWRKSTHSGQETDCVEITMDVDKDGNQDIGDSKNHGGATLTFRRTTVAAFMAQAKAGGIEMPGRS